MHFHYCYPYFSPLTGFSFHLGVGAFLSFLNFCCLFQHGGWALSGVVGGASCCVLAARCAPLGVPSPPLLAHPL